MTDVRLLAVLLRAALGFSSTRPQADRPAMRRRGGIHPWHSAFAVFRGGCLIRAALADALSSEAPVTFATSRRTGA